MKVLLCSPCKPMSTEIGAGIKAWANNLLEYYRTICSDVKIVEAPFDRDRYISVDTNIVKRIVFGITDYGSCIKNAIHKMNTENCDVVHICTSASLGLAKDLVLVKAAKKRGLKSAVHFHFGRIPELAEKKNWEWSLLRKVVECADCIITMDQSSYTTLCNLGYKHVRNCPNPLSSAIMKQIEAECGTIKRIPNKLLFVGHVLPSKGVYELVEASSRFADIELHIVGKAQEPVCSQLLAMAKKRGNGGWLKMRGELQHEDVLREMQSASVFVFPTYTEGFPGVILEAMACGCPIVTTMVGAIPEMLDIYGPKKYGICVAPQDENAIADGIKKMLNNIEFAHECAANAKLRVFSEYAVAAVWQQLSTIWKSI